MRAAEPIDRVMRRVTIDPESGCWLLIGKVDRHGYGQISVRAGGGRRRTRRSHHITYEHFVGPIPAGSELDHLCHDPADCGGGPECPHRRCVCPWHLALSNPAANHAADRAASPGRDKAECEQGHPLSGGNLYTNPSTGQRCCRICRREARRRYKVRQG